MRCPIFRHSSRSFQGTGFCQWRFGVDFNFSKNGMWFTAGGVLGILEECRFGFPQCFGYWIANPFDQIFIALSMFPVLQDLFHFVHFFTFFYVWWWLDIIFFINLVLSIRMEQCSMEDFVDLPRFQKFQLVSYWSQHFFNLKWSLSFWSHLLMIICLQMP
jgi:hypothetical protein